LPRKFCFEILDVDVDASVSKAIAALRRSAASARDVELPQITVPSTVFAEVAALHSERLEKTPEVFHPSIRPLLQRAGKISAGEYIRNRQALWELRRHTDIFFPDVDLLTPAIDEAAVTIEEALKSEPLALNRDLGFQRLGVPAISVAPRIRPEWIGNRSADYRQAFSGRTRPCPGSCL
jgi:Asp-tRNA(Asn)/Glu-tRNA(Gln) amidotransferase A subunit family amidase